MSVSVLFWGKGFCRRRRGSTQPAANCARARGGAPSSPPFRPLDSARPRRGSGRRPRQRTDRAIGGIHRPPSKSRHRAGAGRWRETVRVVARGKPRAGVVGVRASPPPHTSFPPVKCRATLSTCGRQLQQRDRKPLRGRRGVGFAGAAGLCGPRARGQRRTPRPVVLLLPLSSSSSSRSFFARSCFIAYLPPPARAPADSKRCPWPPSIEPAQRARACCEDERGGGERSTRLVDQDFSSSVERESERGRETRVQGRKRTGDRAVRMSKWGN